MAEVRKLMVGPLDANVQSAPDVVEWKLADRRLLVVRPDGE